MITKQRSLIRIDEAQEVEKITEVTVMKEEPVLEQPFDELEAVLFSSEEPVEDSLEDDVRRNSNSHIGRRIERYFSGRYDGEFV